jgi:hypothetical protein
LTSTEVISRIAKKGAGTIIRGGGERCDPLESGTPNEDLWKNVDKDNLEWITPFIILTNYYLK